MMDSEEQIARFVAAKEELHILEDGILLYHDKANQFYIVAKARNLKKEETPAKDGANTKEKVLSIHYNADTVINQDVVVVPYGTLLMRLVSINREAFDGVISYLKAELSQTKMFAGEIDYNDTFYRLDRMEEMEYHIYHNLVRLMPFETRESITEDELEIITRIFLSEMKRIYTSDLADIHDIGQMLPDVLTDDALREELKDFLCGKEFGDDFYNKYLQDVQIRTEYFIVGGSDMELINLQSFRETIALEVYNNWKHRSKAKKYTRCEVCGRLFRQTGGRPSPVCFYPTIDGISCKEKYSNNPYKMYAEGIRNNLKSFISSRGLQAYSSELYNKFDCEVQKILELNEDLPKFKKDVDNIYSNIQELGRDYKSRENEK